MFFHLTLLLVDVDVAGVCARTDGTRDHVVKLPNSARIKISHKHGDNNNAI